MILTLLLKTRRKPVTTGIEVLLGQSATVVSGFPGDGRVLVDGGEIWQAKCDRALVKGQSVTVRRISGLYLDVEDGYCDPTSNKE